MRNSVRMQFVRKIQKVKKENEVEKLKQSLMSEKKEKKLNEDKLLPEEGDEEDSEEEIPHEKLRKVVIDSSEVICHAPVNQCIPQLPSANVIPLKPHFPQLPACHKTLLRRNEESMFRVQKFNKMITQMTLNLFTLFNVDGLPISNSSLIEFWLIVGKIFMEDISISHDPFAIAAWKGADKPKSVEIFLEDFITELNSILEGGVIIQKVHFKVEVHCFSCDKPARAFIICTIVIEASLHKFAELSARVYGGDSQNLTLHSFIHLVGDVQNMNCNVSQMTAFPFENKFSRYKKFLKSGYKPLHQLCYHIENDLKNYEGPKVYKDEINYSRRKSNGNCLINSVNYKQFYLSEKSPDNVVLLKNGDIQQLYAETKGSDVMIKGQKVQIIEEAFTYSMNSSLLGIHEVEFTVRGHIFPLKDVGKKMLRISVIEIPEEEKKDYVVPFLHT
ncbi:hypothetical protein QAD02_020195 [Eretmocerus hayati]|uniref:Uncharacterized protein n=1 Tax=Eretmocerus hayati TaxID=131215 RepID=A0ACC2PMZ7_9HYME|nr:hypothetical protein QAD02_020195 [Eretmocerus hayati]